MCILKNLFTRVRVCVCECWRVPFIVCVLFLLFLVFCLYNVGLLLFLLLCIYPMYKNDLSRWNRICFPPFELVTKILTKIRSSRTSLFVFLYIIYIHFISSSASCVCVFSLLPRSPALIDFFWQVSGYVWRVHVCECVGIVGPLAFVCSCLCLVFCCSDDFLCVCVCVLLECYTRSPQPHRSAACFDVIL